MQTSTQRRQFITRACGLGSLCLLPTLAKANGRTLKLHNIHTGESIVSEYTNADGYDKDALKDLNHLLRDHRQNIAKDMDPALFDQLWQIQQLLGDTESIEIISGYRTRKTNNMLRAESKQVASNSYHPKGRAIDFRFPKVPIWQVRNVAWHIKAGGVGYYERSNFVHIDTGPHRKW